MNSILKSKDGKDLIMTCTCGCEDSIHFTIDTSDPDFYCCMSYMSGNWYRDQNESAWDVFRRKCKKIWRIIRNKDHHYSDIHMRPEDFDLFREYVNFVAPKED
jgi:hypothetical protein